MTYHVTLSEALRQRLAELIEEAEARGQGQAARDAARILHDRLTNDPHNAGERKYTLATGNPVYSAGQWPLVMTYAVYDSAQVVWVFAIHLLSTLSA